MPILPRLKVEEADWRGSQSSSQLLVGDLCANPRERLISGIGHCIGKEEFKAALGLGTRRFPPDGLVYDGLQIRRCRHFGSPSSPIVPCEGSAGKPSKRTERLTTDIWIK